MRVGTIEARGQATFCDVLNTAAEPAISFIGDTDTGFFPGTVANTIGFATGGSETFTISASGTITAPDGSTSVGGPISFLGGDGDGAFAGGAIALTAGDAGTSGVGGAVAVTTGDGGATDGTGGSDGGAGGGPQTTSRSGVDTGQARRDRGRICCRGGLEI